MNVEDTEVDVGIAIVHLGATLVGVGACCEVREVDPARSVLVTAQYDVIPCVDLMAFSARTKKRS